MILPLRKGTEQEFKERLLNTSFAIQEINSPFVGLSSIESALYPKAVFL
jgi:hypothetical protein